MREGTIGTLARGFGRANEAGVALLFGVQPLAVVKTLTRPSFCFPLFCLTALAFASSVVGAQSAAAAARWVFELDPGFAPQERGSILLGYKMLGFAATERLVRVQASLRRRSGADPA